MFTCTQCTKAYKRPEHLQRHIATHSDERPYVCELCEATFQRSDVLRRHSKTCNGPRHAPPKGTPAAANAYDVAAHVTKGSDGVDDLSAYLDWLPDVDEYADLLMADYFPGDYSAASVQPPAGSDAFRHDAPLRFLEGFTRKSGLVASFDCGTEEQRTATLLYLRSHSQPQEDAELLSSKCGEIVELVKEVATIKPRNSPVDLIWSPSDADACISFFSPKRVQLYLGLFWSLWHPNVNYMHRATFDPSSAKATLVAAMAVMGAAVSPEDEDNRQANLWFNAVEEIVFIDDDFYSGLNGPFALPTLSEIQSLQAAYIVCLYQNWQGTDSSKARIRRFRYSTVVSMVRDLGVSNARHKPFDHQQETSRRWAEFAVREQLIRTLMWIFLLDTAFVIFHNFPPRMVLREAQMHLACNEQVFQAKTCEEWDQIWSLETADTDETLATVVQRMCKERLNMNTQAQIAALGPLNLFAATSALHVMIFYAQQTFNVQASVQPLSCALDNWIAAWNIYTGALHHLSIHDPLASEAITPSNMWKRVGFSRFADEYWLLARLITEKMKLSAEKTEPVNDPAVQDCNSFNLRSDEEAILPKYDETSMRQVNSLIADFQKIFI